MKDNQRALKKLKIFREIIAWMITISFIGLIVGGVMLIWFGVIGLKILLTGLVSTIFFRFLFIVTDKTIADCKQQHEI